MGNVFCILKVVSKQTCITFTQHLQEIPMFTESNSPAFRDSPGDSGSSDAAVCQHDQRLAYQCPFGYVGAFLDICLKSQKRAA